MAMPTEVEPAVLKRLLDLQTEDSEIRMLTERKASLPEAQRLAEINAQLVELNADIEIASKQNDEVTREQNRLEGEIELVEQKTAKEEQRMYSGGVSNPKELSSLQAEVESLKRKKGTLEDELLEVMERREQASATLQSLTEERDQAQAEAGDLTTRVEALTTDIDQKVATHSSARVEIAGSIPSEVLSLYDKLRDQKGGVGAAALEQGTCQGCHTKLPAKEVERVKSEGGLQRCDNCRRILVVV